MKMPSLPLGGVLFDLDGTLLDSAPDLYAALVAQCEEEGVEPPPYAPVREVVSRGSRGVLGCAFADADDMAIAARVPRFLELYRGLMSQHTKPFEGVDTLLRALDTRGVRWGIVTNKPGFLTDELLVRLDLGWRMAAVVSGDTLPVKKPDPAPVLHACVQAGFDPRQCVFVGDDRRDVQAGKAAGLFTIAAAWGYLDGGDPHSWQADVVIDTPAQLSALLDQCEVAA